MPKLDRFTEKPAEFWQQVRADWRTASLDGQTAVRFCELRGIAPDTFNKKLKKWRAEAQAALLSVQAKPGSPANLGQALAVADPGSLGKARRTGRGAGGEVNAASPPLLLSPSPARPTGSKPSTVQALEDIEQAAADAAVQLVATMRQAGPVGLKAVLEVLDRAGVQRQEKATKQAPYADLSEEQLAARLQVLAPQVLPGQMHPTTS